MGAEIMIVRMPRAFGKNTRTIPAIGNQHDRNGARYLQQGRYCRARNSQDDIRRQCRQLGCKFAHRFRPAVAPAIIEAEVLAHSPTPLLQRLGKRGEPRLTFRIVRSERREHADAPHPLALLRARRDRPRSCRAADERDELAPFYLIGLHSVPVSQGRIAGYRIGEDQSGDNGTILQPVGRWRGRPFAGRARAFGESGPSKLRQRPPTSRSNPHAGDFDPAPAGDHALDARRREPGVDQLDQELGLEPVGQHDRLGAAVDGCLKQFEGSTALLLSGRHLGLGDVGSAYEIAT